jgi:hypothetical protein
MPASASRSLLRTLTYAGAMHAMEKVQQANSIRPANVSPARIPISLELLARHVDDSLGIAHENLSRHLSVQPRMRRI